MKCCSITIGTVFFGVLVLGIARAYGGELAQPSGDYLASATARLVNDAAESLPAEEGAEEQPERYAETSPAEAPEAPKPWKMPQLPALKCMGVDMGGWLEQGITFNNFGHDNTFNGPLAINDLNDQYQLNQFWLYFVKPTKTDGCGVDIGGRIDLSYGTDWRFGECYGLENRIDSPDHYYGLILPQFYLEVAIDDLTVKMGHFATFTSYEAVPAPLNFFYSHAYLMGGYFDPLLVTGLQGDYKLNDCWTAVGGFNRGPLQFEDQDEDLNFLGGVRYTSADKKATLSLLVDAGEQQGFTGLHDRETVFLVYTYQLNKCLLYASQYDVGREKHGSVIEPGDNAEYYGLEQVLIRKLNDCWSLGFRFEWVRDEDGSRIAGIGNAIGSDKGWLGQPGFAGDFTDVTVGMNYRPNPNFVLRPEIRWDWYDGPRNVANQLPFDNFASSHQFTAAVDLIFTY